MRRNGESNPVTYIVIVLVAAVAFYGFHVAPVYIDNLSVKEATSEAFNVYWLSGEKSARDKLLFTVNSRIGKHFEVGEDGVETEKPGLNIPEDNVVIEETDSGLTVRVSYERVVQFSPLKKRKTFQVKAEKVGKKGE